MICSTKPRNKSSFRLYIPFSLSRLMQKVLRYPRGIDELALWLPGYIYLAFFR